MIESRLGYSTITECVYWGKVNTETHQWLGKKKDVTDNFLNVLLDGYLPENSHRGIEVNGKSKYDLFNISHTREGFNKAIAYLNKEISALSE